MQRPVGQAGRLSLGINRLQADVIGGAGFDVTVQVSRQTGTIAQPAVKKPVDLPASPFSFPDLPTRLNAGKGHSGDAVNLDGVGGKAHSMATFCWCRWR